MVAQIPNCGTLLLQGGPGDFAPSIVYALATKSGVLYEVQVPNVGPSVIKPLATGFTGARTFEGLLVSAGNSVTSVDLMTGMKRLVASDAAPILGAAVDAGIGDILYATGVGIKRVAPPEVDNATLVVESEEGTAPQALASAYDTLYYTSSGSNNVQAFRSANGSPVVVAAAQEQLLFGHNSLQIDDTNLYWANGSLQMAPLDNPAHPVSTIAHPIDDSRVIAFAVDSADGGIAYIATQDGSFEKASFDSKDEAIWIARALPAVTSVVLSDYDVYLASECTIFKSPRIVFDTPGK
jgi:hypothetical protein